MDQESLNSETKKVLSNIKEHFTRLGYTFKKMPLDHLDLKIDPEEGPVWDKPCKFVETSLRNGEGSDRTPAYLADALVTREYCTLREAELDMRELLHYTVQKYYPDISGSMIEVWVLGDCGAEGYYDHTSNKSWLKMIVFIKRRDEVWHGIEEKEGEFEYA